MPFKKGHRLSVGNKGPHRDKIMTIELISQLNELDPQSQRPKIHKIIKKLIARGCGEAIVYVGRGKKRKKVILDVDADIPAIKELFDRVEGKAVQKIAGDNNEDPINIRVIERVIVHPKKDK